MTTDRCPDGENRSQTPSMMRRALSSKARRRRALEARMTTPRCARLPVRSRTVAGLPRAASARTVVSPPREPPMMKVSRRDGLGVVHRMIIGCVLFIASETVVGSHHSLKTAARAGEQCRYHRSPMPARKPGAGCPGRALRRAIASRLAPMLQRAGSDQTVPRPFRQPAQTS